MTKIITHNKKINIVHMVEKTQMIKQCISHLSHMYEDVVHRGGDNGVLQFLERQKETHMCN